MTGSDIGAIVILIIVLILMIASVYFSYKVFSKILKFIKKELFSD